MKACTKVVSERKSSEEKIQGEIYQSRNSKAN